MQFKSKLAIIVLVLMTFTLSLQSEIIPYLQTPTSNSIWVTWKTHVDGNSTVQYGLSESNLNMTVNGSTTELFDSGYSKDFFWHKVKLTNLQPNTTYYYKVISGAEQSQVFRFRSQPLEGTNTGIYRVLVAGDHQIVNESRFLKLMNHAKSKIQEKYGENIEQHINLVVNVGDQVDLGNLTHYDELHLRQNAPVSPYLPIMTLMGNHETYGNTYQGGPRQSYFDLFVLDDNVGYNGIYSGTEEYYSFQVANIVFLMMSTEAPGTTQLSWATNVINTAKNDNNIDWIISEGHRPIYAEQYYNDVSPWVRDNIIPKLTQTEKAALHIGAHHHLYARGQERDYPLYNIISGGTAWNQSWGMSSELDHDNVQKTISEWAYQIVTFDLDKKEMYVEVYSVGNWVDEFDNKLIDSFYRKIGKTGPNKPAITNDLSQPITLPYTFESSAYSTNNGEPYNSVQFQIASDENFENLEFDLIRDFENIYGDETGTQTDIEDRNLGVNIFEQTIPNYQIFNGTHYVRVRHRDKNIVWSDWSEPEEFEVIGSLNGEPEVAVNKKGFNLNEDIIVSFNNGPGNSKDWIAIYPKGIDPGEQASSDWSYVGGASSGTVTLNIGSTGEFYTVLLENDGYNEISNRAYFYVGTIPAVTTNKTKYETTESITVNFSNAPSLANDWIGIYKMGETPGQGAYSTDWEYVSGSSGSVQLGPLSKGYYFVNYFLQDAYFEPGERALFQVGEQISTVSTDKTDYNLGEDITVFFENGAGTQKDWIGIFKSGDDPQEDPLVQYLYVGGRTSGDVTFTDDKLPNEPGEYFVALFINDSYDEISNRIYFNVGLSDNPKDPRFGMNFEGYLWPFYHGVASGDPLQDRIIIWTRVTPEKLHETLPADRISEPVLGGNGNNVSVEWIFATDKELQNVVKSGEIITGPDNDYTVKIDVDELTPNTVYYYGFKALNKHSIIGRTKTLPAAGDENCVTLAVTTCSSYEWGYFNGYGHIANRNDLDAWVMTGDYFYEYGADNYGFLPAEWPDGVDVRDPFPDREVVTLSDYRKRYFQHRLDKDLRKLHQQVPVIPIWDDHEIANDSWKGGAQNHDPETEGSWEDRVNNALQTFYDWLPIRVNNPSNLRQAYRQFKFGNLLDLNVMEARVFGRDKQLAPKGEDAVIDPTELYDPTRTILGKDQLYWLYGKLYTTQSTWKLAVSSVMMMQTYGFGPQDGIYGNVDAWDGYPMERWELYDFLMSNNVKNFGILSGDFHMSFAGNLTPDPLEIDFPIEWPDFNPMTGAGAVGFEFTTPSVTSANLNEQRGMVLEGIPLFGLPERSPYTLAIENMFKPVNPHMKYFNSDQHGYLVINANNDMLQGDFWYVYDPLENPLVWPNLRQNNPQYWSSGYYLNKDSYVLNQATEAYTCIDKFFEPAPEYPPVKINLEEFIEVCYGGTVDLGFVDNNGNIISAEGGSGEFTYNWQPSYKLQNPTSGNPTFGPVYFSYNSFEVTITDVKSGLTFTKSITVSTLPQPQVIVPIFKVISSSEGVCYNLTDLVGGNNIISQQWYKQVGSAMMPIDGTCADLHNIGIHRVYVQGIDENGCSSKMNRIIFFTMNGKENIDESNLVISENGMGIMYVNPNPADEHITLFADFGEDANISVSIIDMAGKSVISFSKTVAYINENINVSNLASGVYFVNVTNGESTLTKKIIKK